MGTNPASDAKLWYVLNSRVSQIEVVIRRPNGVKLRTLTGTTGVGLNALSWDLSLRSAPADGARRRFRGPTAGTGVYVLEFLVDGALRQTETFEPWPSPASQFRQPQKRTRPKTYCSKNRIFLKKINSIF